MRLDRLAPLLARSSSWDQEMTLDEQQRIALTRVLLHKPDWVVQDEAMSELDDDNKQLAESLLREELANTVLISIGRKSGNGHFYHRMLELQVSPPLPMTLESQSQLRREAQLHEIPSSSQVPFVAPDARADLAIKTSNVGARCGVVAL